MLNKRKFNGKLLLLALAAVGALAPVPVFASTNVVAEVTSAVADVNSVFSIVSACVVGIAIFFVGMKLFRRIR